MTRTDWRTRLDETRATADITHPHGVQLTLTAEPARPGLLNKSPLGGGDDE